jgi:Tfp pilus assembly protein PilN
MIKINLLPGYIIERRRVKALVVVLAFVLLVEVAALAAYLWAPAPFSLAGQYRRAEADRKKWEQEEYVVQQLEEEVAATAARFADKNLWVQWVKDADRLPEVWVRYFETLNKYVPADVVLNGLPLPSGNSLNLSGQTSNLMAAARWYLNMLRCELVLPDPGSVTFSPGSAVYPGEVVGANPKMQQSVGIRVALRPEALDMITLVPAPPAGVAGGRPVGGRGRMGAAPAGGGRARGRGMGMGGPRGGRGRGRGM